MTWCCTLANPRGHRVGRGAGGRRHDQAVGLLAAHELTVDMQFELDHARGFAGVQHHIIERIALTDGLAMTADFGLTSWK